MDDNNLNKNNERANNNNKEQLTGFYRHAFYFTFEDKPQDFFLTLADTDNSEYDKSLISFIETYKDDESVVYQRIQELYVIFLTRKCLIFDHNAHYYILKPDLWQLHQFWIEFYIYILWKLEEINTNQLDIKVAEEKYKTHLINEMKAINKILNYYNDLQIAANTSTVSLRCKLFDAIHEFRQEVQSFLETFYKADNISQFYKSILTISSEIQSADMTVQSNGSEPHLQSTSVVKNVRESSTIDQNNSKNAESREINDEHKIKKHQQCLIINTAFLLAFTVDFYGVRNSCFHLYSALQETKASCSAVNNAPSYLDYMLKRHQRTILNAVFTIIRFLEVIRSEELKAVSAFFMVIAHELDIMLKNDLSQNSLAEMNDIISRAMCLSMT